MVYIIHADGKKLHINERTILMRSIRVNKYADTNFTMPVYIRGEAAHIYYSLASNQSFFAHI